EVPGKIVHRSCVMTTARPHHRTTATVTVRLRDVGVMFRGGVSTREVLVRVISSIGDQSLRRQRFAPVVCGTVRLTAPTFCARVEIEHVLPRELLEGTGAELLIGCVLRVHHGVDI